MRSPTPGRPDRQLVSGRVHFFMKGQLLSSLEWIFILDLNLPFLTNIHLQAAQSMDLMNGLFISNFSFKCYF